ncbi:MAG: hypothetical protein PWP45_1118 [Tepidanaerobacteraceae bacterium]|nr:hypothetical protein [Tepidanaerobacteraceae bacterium]
MPNVVISGYYGFDNLGDEAVLHAIISALRQEAPGIEITVLSNNPTKTEELHGIKSVSRWNLIEILSSIKKADMLISGGGSLLQDVTSPASLLYYLGVIFLAKALRKKVFIYAQGFGPVKRKWARVLTKNLLQRVEFITLRDEDSAEELKSLGVKRPPIVVTADPVMGLDVSHIEKKLGASVLEQVGTEINRPLVGFALRRWKKEESYLASVADCADRLLDDGVLPVFIPFHMPDDLEVSRAILQKMKRKGAVLIEEQLTPDEMISLISNLTLIVGMRLHSLIMASVVEKPVLGISYDPKVERFLRMISDVPAMNCEDVSAEKLYSLIKSRIKQGLTSNERLKIAELRCRALSTSKLAVRCLNDVLFSEE